jgi:cellulase
MKTFLSATFIAALAAQQVAGHATFQDLWVNGVDYQGTCVRLPSSNNPITDVTGSTVRCNVNNGAVAGKCTVAAGGIVTAEMHQVRHIIKRDIQISAGESI